MQRARGKWGGTFICVKTLSFVFVSHATSICCRRIDRGLVGMSIHGTIKLRPGVMMPLKRPQRSIICAQ